MLIGPFLGPRAAHLCRYKIFWSQPGDGWTARALP